jgi:phospholipid/cholesterol/gamma-HCH transport system substrate-binding protein
MSEQRLAFRLGVFVILAGLLLVGLVVFIAGTPSLGVRKTSYTLLFSDAPGVGVGTPIRRSGVRVGEVVRVELDDESGQVRVGIAIDPGFVPRASDEPTISQGLISGDTSIDFMTREAAPGEVLDRKPVQPDAVIVGRVPVDVRRLVDPAQASLEQIRKSLERFEKLAPQVEDTLREFGDLARVTREFVPEIRRSNDAVREVLDSSRGFMADIRRIATDVQGTLRTYDGVGKRMDRMLQTNEEKISKAIDSAVSALDQLSKVFNEQNQKNIQVTLDNVRKASDSFDDISKSTDGLLNDTRKIVQRFDETINRVEKIMTNVDQATKPLAERSDKITLNLEQATEQLAGALADARELMRAFTQSEGTVQKLLTDPGLYNNLNDSLQMLPRVIARLDRVMKDFEVFADKIARHPESLGVGGAVRPSAGLKEGNPYAPPRTQQPYPNYP